LVSQFVISLLSKLVTAHWSRPV